MNIKELLNKCALSHPRKPAIIFGETEIDFLRLRDSSFKVANYLSRINLSQSDKIALFLPNIPQAIFSILGIFSIGSSAVPLDFMLTEEELINFINHSEAKIFIAYPKKEIDLARIKKDCPLLKEIIICGQRTQGFPFWDEHLSDILPDEPKQNSQENSLCSVFYTSGSTGHPKGVMLSFKHLDNPVKTIGHFLKVTSNDIFLCGGVPFSHIGGLDYILLMLYFGSTLVLTERFQPLEFLKSIEKHKVTIFCIVPAMYVAVLSLKNYDGFDFSSLRYAVVFGAPSSPVLLKKFNKAYFNACLLNGWGLTETAAPNGFSPPNINKLKSIGKLDFGIEAKIVNNEGNVLNSNQEGELLVRGEAVMLGYYKEPALTKQVLTDQGWFNTGDIAERDKEGLYYIVGRKKDMIKVAGEIVFSVEVEEAIQAYPGVKEAAVIGVLDKMRGEVPSAFVALNENINLDAQGLKDFLRERLAHFKIPRYFEFRKFLPRNRTGKIDKQALRKSHTSQGHQSQVKDRY